MSNDISDKFEKDLIKLLDKYGIEKTDYIKKLIIKSYSGKKLPLISIRYRKQWILWFNPVRKLIKKADKYKFETDLLNILKKCKYRTDNVQTLEIICEADEKPIIKLSYYQF